MFKYFSSFMFCWQQGNPFSGTGSEAVTRARAAARMPVSARNTWARRPAQNIQDQLGARGCEKTGGGESQWRKHQRQKRTQEEEGKPSPLSLQRDYSKFFDKFKSSRMFLTHIDCDQNQSCFFFQLNCVLWCWTIRCVMVYHHYMCAIHTSACCTRHIL